MPQEEFAASGIAVFVLFESVYWTSSNLVRARSVWSQAVAVIFNSVVCIASRCKGKGEYPRVLSMAAINNGAGKYQRIHYQMVEICIPSNIPNCPVHVCMCCMHCILQYNIVKNMFFLEYTVSKNIVHTIYITIRSVVI